MHTALPYALTCHTTAMPYNGTRDMGATIGYDRPLLLSTRDGIRLLGGAARIWDRCLAAGWIRPAVRIHYYRYGDIAALAERLCRERPPRVITVGMKEVE